MVEIEQKLYNEIKEYCRLNHLVIKDFVNKLLRKAFTIEKYGETPFVKTALPIDNKQPEPIKPVWPVEYEQPEPIKTIEEIPIDADDLIYHQTVIAAFAPIDNISKTTLPKVDKKSKKRKL